MKAVIDNSNVSMLETLNELLPKYKKLSIATGYWDFEGLYEVFEKLKEYDEIRILIGREPLIKRYKQDIEVDFPELDFFKDLEEMYPNPKFREMIIEFKELVSLGKVKVKVWRDGFLHAKCYIFGDFDSTDAVGIIGSSNFTKAGLQGNYELNALEKQSMVVLYQPNNAQQDIGHLAWFNKLWVSKFAEEWTGKFTELIDQSPIGTKMFTPYEVYIRTLYELYSEELVDSAIIKDDSELKLMPYQIRNVHMLKRKLEKRKVAMLADSVGLGKTATAIEVIKQYRRDNKRVEVITPKSLQNQWTTEMLKFGLGADFIPVTPFQNHGELDRRRELDKWVKVSLFIIDESHNLRNINSQRYEWLLNWIENNPDAHVLLLTATPINNQIGDLSSQILLGSKGDPNIAQVLVESSGSKLIEKKSFYEAIKDIEAAILRAKSSEKEADDNYNKLKKVIREVVSQFVVRNTRVGISKDPEFKGKFPNPIPQAKEYSFSEGLTKRIVDEFKSFEKSSIKDINPEHLLWFNSEALLSKETVKKALHPLDLIQDIPEIEDQNIQDKSPIYFIFQLILMLGFMPYRWKLYQEKFYGKTYQQIFDLNLNGEEQLSILSQLSIYGMLRVGYLKRLESSVYAIRESLGRYHELLGIMKESIIKKNQIIVSNKLDLLIDYLDGNLADPEAFFNDDKTKVIEIDNTFKKVELLNDIEKDILLINVILKQLEILEEDDSKIKKLAEIINEVHEKNINGGKVLLFSYFSDTIGYLSENLSKYCPILNTNNSGFATGQDKSTSLSLADRFAPNAKSYTFKEGETEIDFLFATDVLSEGQNLQDAGVIINFDLHWNPVRMIQRNGRINRLGSRFENIYIYNMFPESQLEVFLGLVKRLQSKIDTINFCIGLDQPVLNENYEAVEFVDDIKKLYSKDTQEAIGVYEDLEKKTDFFATEDSFIQDLREFDQNSSEEEKTRVYKYIPNGKWNSQPNVLLEKAGQVRPQVLFSNKLFLKSDSDELKYLEKIMFASTEYDGEIFSQVDELTALQFLKCEQTDSEICTEEKISKLDRRLILENAERSLLEGFYNTSLKVNSLTNTELNVLRRMTELMVDDESVQIVKNSLMKVTNELRKNKLRKLLHQWKKDDMNNLKLTSLVSYAKESYEKSIETTKEDDKVDIIKPFLLSVS